jgi:superfamily II DNA/RNA helicase
VLRREPVDRALVFTRTKHGADKVVRGLIRAGIGAQAIHGNKSQNQRERVLAAFRKGEVRTLVATDIAARGLDVDGVSHVVNFDLPNVPETYVHRIGRTARAGAEGIAISLCDGEEVTFLRDIEKLIRMTIPVSDSRADGWRADGSPAKRASSQSPGTAKQRHWHRGGPAREQSQPREGGPSAELGVRRSRPADATRATAPRRHASDNAPPTRRRSTRRRAGSQP